MTGAGLLAGSAEAKGSAAPKPDEGFALVVPPRLANILLVSMLDEMLANGSAEALTGAGFGALSALGVKPEGFALAPNPDGFGRALLKGSLLLCAAEMLGGGEILGAAEPNGSLLTEGALGGSLLLMGSLRKSRSSSFSFYCPPSYIGLVSRANGSSASGLGSVSGSMLSLLVSILSRSDRTADMISWN